MNAKLEEEMYQSMLERRVRSHRTTTRLMMVLIGALAIGLTFSVLHEAM